MVNKLDRKEKLENEIALSETKFAEKMKRERIEHKDKIQNKKEVLKRLNREIREEKNKKLTHNKILFGARIMSGLKDIYAPDYAEWRSEDIENFADTIVDKLAYEYEQGYYEFPEV